MKPPLGMLLMLLLAGPALAQEGEPPPGSYMESCINPVVHGDGTLTAACKDMNGELHAAGLPDVYRCVEGSIGNANGTLVCNYR
jgi:hypothetical protein